MAIFRYKIRLKEKANEEKCKILLLKQSSENVQSSIKPAQILPRLRGYEQPKLSIELMFIINILRSTIN